MESCAPATDPIIQALVAGCFLNLARKLPTPDGEHRCRAPALSHLQWREYPSTPLTWTLAVASPHACRWMCVRLATARTRARYKTMAGGQLVSIHPTSVLFGRSPLPECVVFNELVVTSRQYMRAVTACELAWLPDLAPQCYARVGAGSGVVTTGAGAPPPRVGAGVSGTAR